MQAQPRSYPTICGIVNNEGMYCLGSGSYTSGSGNDGMSSDDWSDNYTSECLDDKKTDQFCDLSKPIVIQRQDDKH